MQLRSALLGISAIVAMIVPVDRVGASVEPIIPTAAASEVPLDVRPARLVDTRPGATTIDGIDAGNGPLPAGTSIDIQITGRAGIPTTATTAILTVTAVDPQGPGHLTVHPAGTTVPNASNLNYLPGHTTANTVIARIGLDGQITIHTHATTHLVIDITGHLPLSLDQVDFDELIVGRWTGDVTVPPGWSPITGFWVEFRVDGTYSAGSNGPTPAFYYGSDADHPSKVYEVVGRYPEEQPGTGAITIHFDVGTVREGSLEEIRFSSGGDRLQFEFWPLWHGRIGPIVYDLVRDPD